MLPARSIRLKLRLLSEIPAAHISQSPGGLAAGRGWVLFCCPSRLIPPAGVGSLFSRKEIVMVALTVEVMSVVMLAAGIGGPLAVGAAWLRQRRSSARQSSGGEGRR